jgi:hypothetical protein
MMRTWTSGSRRIQLSTLRSITVDSAVDQEYRGLAQPCLGHGAVYDGVVVGFVIEDSGDPPVIRLRTAGGAHDRDRTVCMFGERGRGGTERHAG